MFISLFIIFVYNLGFYEANPKCFVSNGEKASRKQTWKNGNRRTISSPTFFNYICDINEMIIVRNTQRSPSVSHKDVLKNNWRLLGVSQNNVPNDA
jgi:hypothetical protein